MEIIEDKRINKVKILILGGYGMLGHKLVQVLSERFEVYTTIRSKKIYYSESLVFKKVYFLENTSVESFDSIINAIKIVKPQLIVNCIGVIKQRSAAKDPITSITINSLFPHRLLQLCQAADIRLIHISTDCVFSGRQGNYLETDIPDAEDLYGRTKLLGEPNTPGCLTIRTSIIGRELESSHGLIEWFLSQEKQKIKGYKKAIFSGFTTLALAEILSKIVTDFPQLSGLYHVASYPISKYDLLNLVKQTYGLNIEIDADEMIKCDRSLNSEKFREATGILVPEWPALIEQMYQDPTPYSQLRSMKTSG